jgi:tetratricopeptide (TPR) repeat protein
MISQIWRAAACILAMALAVPAAAKDEWWEARTDHFVVITQDSEANARAYAERMERFDNALRTMQNMPLKTPDIGEANRVRIYRFGETDDIGRLAGVNGVAGFYRGLAGSPVAFAPVKEGRETGSLLRNKFDPEKLDAESVLKHEYVHHFMLYNFPATYPSWYVEGYAEFFATLDLRPDGSFHVGNPPNYRASALKDIVIMPTSQLFDSERKMGGLDWLQRYSLGWLLTHYLSLAPEREGQLSAYLTALGKGEKSLDAAKRVFGDLGKLDRDLRRHLSGKLPGLNVKPASYSPPVVRMRAITGAEADTMMDRIRLAAGLDRKDAGGVVSSLQTATAKWPDYADGWTMLAEAQAIARDFDAADRSADKALQLAPNSMAALLAKADIAILRERKQPGSAKAARPFLVKAARLDERDPRPLINYYLSYRLAKEEPTESSLIGLETAYETAAHDRTFRYFLGTQLLAEGKGNAAKSILLPLAVSLHGIDPKKNKIGEAMDLIEAGKLAEAHALLLKEEEEQRRKEDKDVRAPQLECLGC